MSDKFNFIKNSLKALLIGSVLFSCQDDIETRYKGVEANRLLSNDRFKSWERVSRSEDGESIDVSSCEELNTLTFENFSDDIDDPDTVLIINRPFECGNGVDSLLVYAAHYTVEEDARGVFENGVVFSDEILSDINRMDITELTSEYLRVEYVQDGKRVQESYVQYP